MRVNWHTEDCASLWGCKRGVGIIVMTKRKCDVNSVEMRWTSRQEDENQPDPLSELESCGEQPDSRGDHTSSRDEGYERHIHRNQYFHCKDGATLSHCAILP